MQKILLIDEYSWVSPDIAELIEHLQSKERVVVDSLSAMHAAMEDSPINPTPRGPRKAKDWQK